MDLIDSVSNFNDYIIVIQKYKISYFYVKKMNRNFNHDLNSGHLEM